jgi:dihydroorotase
MFLKHLVQLHKDFPKLKIVLEHASSAAAVECVMTVSYLRSNLLEILLAAPSLSIIFNWSLMIGLDAATTFASQ